MNEHTTYTKSLTIPSPLDFNLIESNAEAMLTAMLATLQKELPSITSISVNKPCDIDPFCFVQTDDVCGSGSTITEAFNDLKERMAQSA